MKLGSCFNIFHVHAPKGGNFQLSIFFFPVTETCVQQDRVYLANFLAQPAACVASVVSAWFFFFSQFIRQVFLYPAIPSICCRLKKAKNKNKQEGAKKKKEPHQKKSEKESVEKKFEVTGFLGENGVIKSSCFYFEC